MRKAQFFIASVVIISIIITSLALNINVPSELNINEFTINEFEIKNFLFAKDSLKQAINYFRINWLLPYNYRTELIINNNFTQKSYTQRANINLTSNTLINSITLTDENNNLIPFGIEWNNEPSREGVIYFQSAINALSKKSYYLYYNKAPSSEIFYEKNKMHSYEETSNYVKVLTKSYEATINKTTGSIKINDLMLDLSNVITCGATEHKISIINLTVTDMNYYLRIKIKGSRFINETFEINQLYFPDEILVIDKMMLADDSTCSNWGVRTGINKTNLENYMDSNGTVEEPTLIKAETLMNELNWIEFYKDNKGLALTTGNTSPIYISSNTTHNNAFIRFIDQAIIMPKGTYINNITIHPLINNHVNETRQNIKSTITALNKELSSEMNNLLNSIKKYFYEINAIVNINQTTGSFIEERKNDNYELRETLFIQEARTLMPLELKVKLKNPDMNGLIIKNIETPIQLSTDNYHKKSKFTNSLNNTGINSTILILNVKPENFNITAIKTSEGTLGMEIYSPNNTLINYYNIVSGNEIIIPASHSGFYTAVLNGTATFNLETTAPKTAIKLPAGLSNESPIYLLINESISDINLTIKTFNEGRNYYLYDNLNNLILTGNASPGITSLSKTINPCINDCIYTLNITGSGPFILNSTTINYASTSKEYLINPLNPEITIISVTSTQQNKPLNIYYNTTRNINQGITHSSDLTFTNDFIINNSAYTFDMNNMEFYYKENEWFKGRGWITCTTECTDSFSELKYEETGSERVIVYANTSVGVNYLFFFYPQVPYFKVLANYTGIHSFGPSWSVNQTQDTYYSHLNSGLKIISEENTNLTGLEGLKNYASKGDENIKYSIAFNPGNLLLNNNVKINKTSMIVNSNIQGIYEFIINENPENYMSNLVTNQQSIKIEYSYESPSIRITGSIID